MAALTVEHLKVLLVEHLKVQFTYWVGGLMVEPACASLTVEPPVGSLYVIPVILYIRNYALADNVAMGICHYAFPLPSSRCCLIL